ncbi:hypothetical protein AWM75_08335 [Aerococcus urinaehominis]|uniref:Uncharacterized protein n=1 Tax=Aerococcus urinaehominis TaxID=128944 RepID=A0A0X8FMC7_9LACT|nr:GNAT family N-acetyltransferase [Aerococcus urinaehominis]AMB99977.1 hypothetical protein AWM75_08335 [Aerococcus urinaehominis]SDM45404.1 Acetyltransferase (GNAT) domain-containing protein [Aerococcus urinaehominis]
MIKQTKIEATSPKSIQDHYASLLGQITWGGGQMLAKKLAHKALLANEAILVLTENDQLVGCGAVLQKDIVPEMTLGPFISAIYVNPEYRGRGLSLKIVTWAEAVAQAFGYQEIYIVTQHIGLYEQNNFTAIGRATDFKGRVMRVLHKTL